MYSLFLLNIFPIIRFALPFLSGCEMITNQIYIMSRVDFVSRYFCAGAYT